MQAGAAMVAATLTLGVAPAVAFELPADAEPVVRDLVAACDAALGGGWVDGDGWTMGAMNPDSQAYRGHDEMFASKDFVGLGQAHLRATVDRFDAATLSTCDIGIDLPVAAVRIGDIGLAAELIGGFSTGSVAEGSWRNADRTLFVTARQLDEPALFAFSMTRIDGAADASN